MNKSFVSLLVVGALLTAGLFFLPKTIVSKGKKQEAPIATANRDKPATTEQSHNEADHQAMQLSPVQAKEIQKAKTAYASSATLANATKLAEAYQAAQRYDSAALVLEKETLKDKSEANMLKTAGYFYQAYTYAIDSDKANSMGQKTRQWYQAALDKNPSLLLAKTNMAMTYVTTQTPMQGISLLREVVADNPDYEPALFNLGLLSLKSNQYAKALERFKHIVNNNPNNAQAQFYWAFALVRLGRGPEAQPIIEKLKKQKDLDPALSAELDNLLTEIK
jgi:tetratricopeptide (TPR) repeat protein